MVFINPSIASANPLTLLESLSRLGNVPVLHVDVEDGHFVPNITFGLATIRELAKHVSSELDAHLLVTNPLDYVVPLSELGFAGIAVHYEAVEYPLEIMALVHDRGMRTGLALNFKTSADALRPFADALDFVVVMTAEPDGEGQRFRPAMLEKIVRIRALLPSWVQIWADGGIDAGWLGEVVAAGADVVVIGRAVWNGEDPAENYRRLSAAASTGG